MRDVADLVFLHLRFYGYGRGEWTDAAVRRYVHDAKHQLGRLSALVRAHAERAIALRSLTLAGLRAKAALVRLLHGADLALAAECIEQRALASLCDDLTTERG